jgi:hypothetical protein
MSVFPPLRIQLLVDQRQIDVPLIDGVADRVVRGIGFPRVVHGIWAPEDTKRITRGTRKVAIATMSVPAVTAVKLNSEVLTHTATRFVWEPPLLQERTQLDAWDTRVFVVTIHGEIVAGVRELIIVGRP